ncbi:hypothetical protein Ocin01_05570 [Orchesella cincta]|uniref:F-box domain-containing protein n=1 Tax=Orchesella cincta TaxID=48709 RepID=A0A1D2N764_ORCCI|nr:hypothetical protein Ocin01_05570 [Orchesella cincta]
MVKDKDANHHPSFCKNSFRKPFSLLYRWMNDFVLGRSRAADADNENTNKTMQFIYSKFSNVIPKSSIPTKNNYSDEINNESAESVAAVVLPVPENSQFMDLPVQVRELIYNLIDAKDVLALRLTSGQLKEDVESCRGLCVKLHDGVLDKLEPLLRTSGIEKLIVEHFVESDDSKKDTYFPLPHLLQVLEIKGRVSDENSEFLLNKFPNLTRLVISFHHSDQRFCISNWKSIHLYNLETLELYSNTFGTTESNIVGDSIKTTLCEINCPNLINFILNIVSFIPARIQEYHVWAQILMSKTSNSLRNVTIHLKQLMHPFIGEDLENFQIINEWTNNLRLETFQVDINSHMNLWYPILDTQANLRILNLAVRNQSWSRLILVLDKSAETLQEVVITRLGFPLSNDGVNTTPLDIGLLGNLKCLKILEMQHQYGVSHGINIPSVIRTTLLPTTIRTLKLSNFLLKPHQALFLLMKLPLLNKLILECWNESEDTLGAFLTVLTFLIKFDLTTVRQIKIMDTRIRMENLEYEIERMRHTLCNKATVFQDKSELYSTLLLQRLLLFNVLNYEHQY